MPFAGTETDRLGLKVVDADTPIEVSDWSDNWATIDGAPGVIAPSGSALPALWGSRQRGMLAAPSYSGIRQVVAWGGQSPRLISKRPMFQTLASPLFDGWPLVAFSSGYPLWVPPVGFFLQNQKVKVTVKGGLFTQVQLQSGPPQPLPETPISMSLSATVFGESRIATVSDGPTVCGRVGSEVSVSFVFDLPDAPAAGSGPGSFSNFTGSTSSSASGQWGRDERFALAFSLSLSFAGNAAMLWFPSPDYSIPYSQLSKPTVPSWPYTWVSPLIDSFVNNNVPLTSVIQPLTVHAEAV